MRDKFGIAISVLIALSLLYFIAPMDDLMTLFGKPQNVGEIAGQAVSYEDFLAEVDKCTTINEIITGSSVQNEQTQQQIRNAAWQEFLDRYMFIKNAKAAGISVGKDEIVALTTTEDASPIVTGNPVFADNKGAFSPEKVVEFVQNISNDPSGNLSTYWKYIQNTIHTQQFYAKYAALFTASAYANQLQKDADVAMNNTTATVDYVLAPYSFEKDSTITVSKAEIKKYYNAHKENYKQKANRDIEYVVYEVEPSTSDIANTYAQMEEAWKGFAAAENVKTYLLKNSDRQYSEYWYKNGELKSINSDIDAFVSKNNSGVSPIYTEGNTYYSAKVVETAKIADSVYVKHILLQGADAKKQADSLLRVINKGGNFSALAAQYSVDQSSADGGELGNIGWMTQTYIIPGFESAFTAAPGKAFILNTQYGTHIAQVVKKTAPVLKKRVAILEKTAIASKETFNNYYAKANTFATIAGGTYEGYQKAVDSLGIYSHSLKVTEATSNYGAIDNAKEITRWVFDNKAGKASNIITVNNNYFFVVVVKTVRKDGYTALSEVAPAIEQMLYIKARNTAKEAEIAGKIAGKTSLEEIAEELGSTVSKDQNVSFATLGGSMIDPAALGAMYVANEGEIAGPVAGAAGVYVFKVTKRETGAFYTEEDAARMAEQKAQYSSQMILPEMMKAAEVEDNRERFF